jgi:phospholipase D1/2
MNGKKYMAAKFAATLRRQLFKHHLGLAPPQHCPPRPGEPYPTPEMRPVGTPHLDVFQTEEDRLVAVRFSFPWFRPMLVFSCR